MCGRFTSLLEWAEIDKLLKALGLALDRVGEGVVNQPDRANIAPTQPVVTLHQDIDTGLFKAELMRWGLVPVWVKDPREFTLIVNARAESLGSKPSFRGSLRHHRCLIPASGYYEWQQRSSGPKQPYYISRKDGRPLFFAGIYSSWMGASGEEIDTTAIITVPAGTQLKDLHPRTPALISDADLADWLDVKRIDERAAFAMLGQVPDGVLSFHPVSRRVNAVANDGKGLVEAVDIESEAPPPQKSAAPGANGKKADSRKPDSGQMDLF